MSYYVDQVDVDVHVCLPVCVHMQVRVCDYHVCGN